MYWMTPRFLPRRSENSACCSSSPRLRPASSSRMRLISSPASCSTAAATMSRLAGSRSSTSARSSCGRLLRASSASSCWMRASRPFCADTGKTRDAGMSSVTAQDSIWRCISASIWASLRSPSHRLSILFSTAMRPWREPPAAVTCVFQTPRSLWVTPVSMPSTNSTACAAGSSDSVSSGSAPIAFRPGVSRMTRPWRSSGCGRLITAWRQAGTCTPPCASGCRPVSPLRSMRKPIASASAMVARRCSLTRVSACCIACGDAVSRRMRVHAPGCALYSATGVLPRRVSIGSRSMQAGRAGSYISSVGHMVVRPVLDGSTRVPWSPKKMALISSDLPRENSATKATTSRSSRSFCRSWSMHWSLCVSPRLASNSQPRRRVTVCSTRVRHAPYADNSSCMPIAVSFTHLSI